METYDFAARLRTYRTEAGLTRMGLAEAAGVSEQTLAGLERRRRTPSREYVGFLCEGLGFADDDPRSHALYLALGLIPSGYVVTGLRKIA